MTAYHNIVDLWVWQGTEAHDGNQLFGFTSVKTETDFFEQAWDVNEVSGLDLLRWFERKPQGDRYFTPRIFNDRVRSNETATPSRFLYADLDHDDLDTDQWPPFWLWETSHRSEQAIWRLDKALSPQEHAERNKWLTYELGADRGGWHGSKLLRVPGTLNYKRAIKKDRHITIPIGHIHREFNDEVRSLRVGQLGKIEHYATGSSAAMPPLPAKDNWNDWVGTVWSGLPLAVRATLEQGVVRDRSRFLWRYYMACKEGGVDIETAFKLAFYMPWNKWNTPQGLWEDINKAWSA